MKRINLLKKGIKTAPGSLISPLKPGTTVRHAAEATFETSMRRVFAYRDLGIRA